MAKQALITGGIVQNIIIADDDFAAVLVAIGMAETAVNVDEKTVDIGWHYRQATNDFAP